MKIKFLVVLAIGIFAFASCQQKATELTPTEAQEIAKEAYIYGFPLVLNYKTMYSYVLAPIMLAKFKEVNNSYALPHQWS